MDAELYFGIGMGLGLFLTLIMCVSDDGADHMDLAAVPMMMVIFCMGWPVVLIWLMIGWVLENNVNGKNNR